MVEKGQTAGKMPNRWKLAMTNRFDMIASDRENAGSRSPRSIERLRIGKKRSAPDSEQLQELGNARNVMVQGPTSIRKVSQGVGQDERQLTVCM